MRKRPPLKKGDLCRYHKSNIQERKKRGRFPNPLMVVISIRGGRDSSDGKALIMVRYLSESVKHSNLKGQKRFAIPRRNLWKCERNNPVQSNTNVVQEVLKMVGMR